MAVYHPQTSGFPTSSQARPYPEGGQESGSKATSILVFVIYVDGLQGLVVQQPVRLGPL